MKQKTKALDILVVENEPISQKSARILLRDHNVEIVENFSHAMDRINGPPFYVDDMESSAFPILKKKRYDAVLTGILLPQGRRDPTRSGVDPSVIDSYGYPIAQFACLNEVPYVGIVSDENPIRKGILFSMNELDMRVMRVNNSRYCVFNHPSQIRYNIAVKTDGTLVGLSFEKRFKLSEKIRYMGESRGRIGLSFAESPEFLESLKEKLSGKKTEITEVDGFAIETEGGRRYLKKMKRGELGRVKGKDWLGALIYLQTAEI